MIIKHTHRIFNYFNIIISDFDMGVVPSVFMLRLFSAEPFLLSIKSGLPVSFRFDTSLPKPVSKSQAHIS